MDFTAIASRVGTLLQQKKYYLATAESCTGGWLSMALTSIAGSSNWFDRGLITYSNLAKQEMLAVPENVLRNYGAVSEQSAKKMLQGALQNSHADVSIAITGIAGPGGGDAEKPVGTVWFAWGCKNFAIQTSCQHFSGDRQAVREQCVQFALENLEQALRDSW